MFSLSGPKLVSKHQAKQASLLQHQANMQKFHLQQQMRFRQFKENLKNMIPLKNAIVTPNDVVIPIVDTETKKEEEEEEVDETQPIPVSVSVSVSLVEQEVLPEPEEEEEEPVKKLETAVEPANEPEQESVPEPEQKPETVSLEEPEEEPVQEPETVDE